MEHMQGLQVDKIETNGYFSEDLGPVKLLEHYHKFYFYFNLTNLEVSYYKLLSNQVILESKNVSQPLINVLQENCKSIENQLSKFKYRTKRALVEVLGTAIKYITGNPDNNDLIEINQHLNSLYKNQDKIIKQMDKYTSFANHITERYSKDLETIQKNLNSSFLELNKINNVLHTQSIILYNNYLSLRLLNILQSIERTVSLAFAEITNLEIISDTELITIINHLRVIYKETELLELDTVHIFKVLEHSKFQIVSTGEIITCILYIPILNPSLYQYSRIYPIPNSQNKVMIPPLKYHLQGARKEQWTDEKCKKIENQIVCVEKTKVNKCFLNRSIKCMHALVNNDYKLYTQLQNGIILVSCKLKLEIIEECLDKISNFKVNGNALVSTRNNCKLIIDDQTFENSFSNFTFQSTIEINNNYETNRIINLQPKHLDDLKILKDETELLEHHIKLHPVIHVTHLSVTFIMLIILFSVCIILYVFRTKITDLIKKEKEDTHELQIIPKTNLSQNEGVLN